MEEKHFSQASVCVFACVCGERDPFEWPAGQTLMKPSLQGSSSQTELIYHPAAGKVKLLQRSKEDEDEEGEKTMVESQGGGGAGGEAQKPEGVE